jgi:hypothetical protein
LRCRVVDAKGVACQWPASVFYAAGTIMTDRVSVSVDRGPRDRYYDQSPFIVRCGSLTRSRTVRAVWNAGGGRRYSRVPASVDSYPGASVRGFRQSAGAPSGFYLHVVQPCELFAADADPPRCACCALEEPEPRRSDL